MCIYLPEAILHQVLFNYTILTTFGRLELEWCERKTLLPGWWLEASAGAM